jgi:hypothetical protein
MLVTYSQETSVSKAVIDTFSGEKPCQLCYKICEAKSSESKKQQDQPILLSNKQFQDFFAPTPKTLTDPLSSPLPPIDFPALADAQDRDANRPITPPPRA